METSSIRALLGGPISAVRGAVETVKYARAFVTRASSAGAGLSADDDERELILEEELDGSVGRLSGEYHHD